MEIPKPLADPLPVEPMERIERFARDLAWGAVHGLWQPKIGVHIFQDEDDTDKFVSAWFDAPIKDYLSQIWTPVQAYRSNDEYVVAENAPTIWILDSLNFVTDYANGRWSLTEKSFDLLKSNRPESIFISYRRSVSSAFAMLIAAELRLVGFQPFIDIQDIPLGDKWHALVEKRVKESSIFIVVLGPESLDSSYVQKEIEWALENEQNRRIIPILHSGYSADELKIAYPTLQQNNLISIQNDHATDFYAALQLLKNALGV
ncbi:MAG: toll/interleukin-1 receptor domain-containing protein [Anaerolineae bacterium]|nr:toll/interleukin-1 receptor domain-containing protein [Anaerolineae bacterium]